MARRKSTVALARILKVANIELKDNATSNAGSGVVAKKSKSTGRRKKSKKSQIEKIKKENKLYQSLLAKGIEKPSRGKKSARTKKRKKIKALQERIRARQIINISAFRNKRWKEGEKQRQKLDETAKKALTEKFEQEYVGTPFEDEMAYMEYYVDMFISQLAEWMDAPIVMIDMISNALDKRKNAIGTQNMFNELQDFVSSNGIKTIWDFYGSGYLEDYTMMLTGKFTGTSNQNDMAVINEYMGTHSANIGMEY